MYKRVYLIAALLLAAVQMMAIDLTVVVAGSTSSSAGVYYGGTKYTKGKVITADDDCEKSDFSAYALSGYRTSIAIDRAANTVTVTYDDIISLATATDTTWYQIKFTNSGAAIGEQGEGNNIKTVSADETSDAQLWCFIGTKTKFQIKSKSGLYMTLADANQSTKVAASANPTVANTYFKYLYKSSAKTYELTRYANSTYGFNQFGGAGTGKEIGLWTTGDGGNALYFYPIAEPDTVVTTEFKISGASSFSVPNAHTLWYKTSAKYKGVDNPWMEYALPIGNGELGAMIYGSVCQDEIQFNEKTLWSGSVTISSQGYYRNFGSLLGTILNRDDVSAVTKYTRYLDIEEGVAGVNFQGSDGTKYTRRYIASAPDQVIAVQYKADGDKKMDMRFSFSPGQSINAGEVAYDGGMGIFTGDLDAVSYAARFQVVPGEGATMEATERGVVVKNASEITVYLKGATNFDGEVADINKYNDGRTAAQVSKDVKSTITAAVNKGFQSVYNDHVADFKSLTDRMSFSLGLTTPTRDTESLVTYFNNNKTSTTTLGNDVLFLEELYFAYGRYLEISSNRKPIAAPNNLQGIWNDKAEAPWHSDIHANINVQMNYWPAEATNLSDLHVPFLYYTIKNAKGDNWKAAATRGGATKGWTFYTENNIFGGMSTWGSNYFVANAWNTSHLWQHYRYTQDKEFLKEAFPVMWSAAEFWMERLIEDKGYDSKTSNPNYGGTAYSAVADGTWVAPNEYSPEQDNHSSEDATAHSQQLISYLFQNVSDAIGILGLDATGLSQSDVDKLNSYLEKIDKGLHTETYTANSSLNSGWTNPRNGVAKGATILREWKYSPYDVSSDPSHRHLSHLMCLFPLEQVDKDSEFFDPAVNSLKLRGDDATGWSLGWKVNLWARALDGDHAHTIIKNALKHSTSYSTNQYAGGIYYNLFDSHAPFQIDGNFGTCSGIAEMLMQSAHGYIHLLPAIPTVWKKGTVKGMKAVGNFTVDETWTSGKCTGARIVSNAGSELRVRCERAAKALKDVKITVNGKEVAVTADEVGIVTIPCQKNDIIDIDFTQEPTGINSVESDENPTKTAGTSAVYDLSGRRVSEAQKGQVLIEGGELKVKN